MQLERFDKEMPGTENAKKPDYLRLLEKIFL